MFGLFKKKRREVEDWEIALLKNTFHLLPKEYRDFDLQINKELLGASYAGYDRSKPEFVSFFPNPEMISRFENKKAGGYKMAGLKVYDTVGEKLLNYSIYVFDGLISGYLIEGNNRKYIIDVNQIDVTAFRKVRIDNKDFDELTKSLDEKEVKFLNPGDVYKIPLKGKSYYHIFDLEDGDFVAIDTEKVIYRITHDPFQIVPLNKSLEQVMNDH